MRCRHWGSRTLDLPPPAARCRQQATSRAEELLGLLATSQALPQGHWQRLAACALQLAAAQQHHGGSVADHCQLLGSLQRQRPGLLRQHAPLLALLALEASRADAPLLLALLYRVLSCEGEKEDGEEGQDDQEEEEEQGGGAGMQGQGPRGVPAADAALALLPAACALALGTSERPRRWGAHLLALLGELQRRGRAAAPLPGAPGQWAGEAALMQQARQVLYCLWGGGGEEQDGAGAQGGGAAAAVAWCQSLAAGLAQARAKR